MNKTLKYFFVKSKKIYDEYVKINKELPTEQQWNEIAKERKLLSTVSMRYIGNIKFKKRVF